MPKGIFKKYYIRLAFEGALKALVCGAVLGAVASIIPAMISFAYNHMGYNYALITLFAVTLGTTPIIYFIFFKPNIKRVSDRVDRLGLDERVVTMMQLQDDNSYIAALQREDAKSKMRQINHRWLKISIFKLPVLILIVALVLSGTAMTVSALTVEDKLDHEVTAEWVDTSFRFRVVNFGEDRTADDKARIASDLVEFGYSTIPQGPGGFVVGNRSQVVRLATVFIDEIDEHGLITTREEVDVPGSATTVVAIAEPGFTFVHWSDQPLPPIPENQTERSLVPTATRTVNNITGDIDENGNIDELNIYAIFEFLKRSDISDSYPDPTPWPPTPPPPEEPPPDDRPPIDFIDGYRDFNDWVEQVVFLIMDDLANGRPVTPDQMAFLEAFLGGLR